jgi:hypothetical protein
MLVIVRCVTRRVKQFEANAEDCCQKVSYCFMTIPVNTLLSELFKSSSSCTLKCWNTLSLALMQPLQTVTLFIQFQDAEDSTILSLTQDMKGSVHTWLATHP